MNETPSSSYPPFPAKGREHQEADDWSCLLDTPPEPIFDDLNRLATSLFNTPVGLISIMDKNRHFFKSAIGVNVREIDRRFSFCTHLLLSESPMVVPDALLDDRFRDNPIVTGDPWVRFYAGVPLISKNGQKLGSFCLIDVKPRYDFTSDRYVELKRFATLTANLIEQRLLEHRLRHVNERFLLAVRASSEGIWDLNYLTWEMHVSAHWNAMLGLPNQDTAGNFEDWIGRIHPYDYESVVSRLAGLERGNDPSLELEYRCRHENGSWRWLLTRIVCQRDDSGALVRVTGSTTDITSARMVDPLTGLHNRNSLLEHLQWRMDRHTEHSYGYGLLFVDLDNFKRVNDSLGRQRGDAVLTEIARRLEETAQPPSGNLVARMAGDEFVLLMDQAAAPEDVLTYASMLEHLIDEPIDCEGQQIFVSASIGVVFGQSTAYSRAEQMLEDADVAMYRAKLHGRAQNAVFSEKMREEARIRLQMESELRRAVDLHELEVWYQPRVRLGSGQVAGFEALARWRSPRLGLVPPAEFIRIAEETGLISEMGRWVAAEAITQLAAWRRQGLVDPSTTIAVNVSPRQFGEADLLEFLLDRLHVSGVPAANFVVEVTEGLLLEDSAVSLAVLRSIVDAGMGLDLDDFGTGYSSLSYLHRFPFRSVKIDRSFIGRMDVDRDSVKLVASIVALASSLNMSAIAEGVETEKQAGDLRNMGCHYGQGYLFSAALPAEEMERYLREQPAPEQLGARAEIVAFPAREPAAQESNTTSIRLSS